jgi:hypothetical protein
MKQTTCLSLAPYVESSPHMDAYNERQIKRRSRLFFAPTESSTTISLGGLQLQYPDEQPLVEEESYRTRCISAEIDREASNLSGESPAHTPLDYEQEPKAPVHLRTISDEVLQVPKVDMQIHFPDFLSSPKQSEEELRATYKRRRQSASSAFDLFSSAASQEPELVKSKKRRRLNHRNLALGGDEFAQILSQIALVGGI